MSIRVRHLRLKGLKRDYDVAFTRGDSVLSLSVIAGEISTGKTSTLDFIAYCLGADDYPEHPEILGRVVAAHMEVDLGAKRVVIERSIVGEGNIAHVHSCSLADLETPHEITRKVVEPAGREDSLSTMLLNECGLARVSLKEAPTQLNSKVQPLSFRDLLWLCYLTNPRLDNLDLLFESHHIKEIKLRQVIEVVFDVHDDALARLGDELKQLEQKRSELLAGLASLEVFLREQHVPVEGDLELQYAAQDSRALSLTVELARLDETMAAQSAFADNLRRAYSEARASAARIATSIRYNDTLLERLLPLRGQYAEDERKLVFFAEAKAVFDPLRVKACPSCGQSLSAPVTIDEGHCSLCRRDIPSGDPELDVGGELSAVRARRREIGRYVEQVDQELKGLRDSYERVSLAERRAQEALDSRVAQVLSPYVAERERLVREIEQTRAEKADLEAKKRWWAGLDQRKLRLSRLDREIERLSEEIKDKRSRQSTKESLVERLTAQFRRTLFKLGFPKLNDPIPPYIDSNFVPHVRGRSYKTIGTSGGFTLVSLAWYLAILEVAVAEGHSHPGFLMIDSPQKNLSPPHGESDGEFKNPEIGSHVWDYILEVSGRIGQSGQLIVVDNRPRPQASGAVVELFTGVQGQGRYGLIDDDWHGSATSTTKNAEA